jgi:hypothetical protein
MLLSRSCNEDHDGLDNGLPRRPLSWATKPLFGSPYKPEGDDRALVIVRLRLRPGE